jgi:hypothetical protein
MYQHPLPAFELLDDDTPSLSLHGLLDAGVHYADSNLNGETAGGLGKFRYDAQQLAPRINEAAFTLQSRLNWDWNALLTAKYASDSSQPFGISEALLVYKPVSQSQWQFGSRFGMFFPPFSMENTGTVWSSPYTLTSSAINTWIGEELRTFGGESHVGYRFGTASRFGVYGALLSNNDTAGAVLAWRGWSLQNHQAVLGERINLPVGIGINRNFPLQAGYSQPFQEIDGRVGYYAGASLEQEGLYQWRGGYYDNLSNPTVVRNGQYAWHTQFGHSEFKLDLPWQTTLISQGLYGRTRMGGFVDGLRPVDMTFASISLLASKTWGQHRVSVRFDRFTTHDHDALPIDENSENGDAWTLNYHYTWQGQQQLHLEMSQISSNRPSRSQQGFAAAQQEQLWQIAYRWFF